MSIRYAILGLLSWKPATGYDIKKMIVDSSVMYWSGNNNQIYKSLVGLMKDDMVSAETLYEENSPVKKLYTITDKGRDDLRKWVASTPEPPELRNTFLIQLAWADQLTDNELISLISRYEEEVNIQLVLNIEKQRRGGISPQRTQREAFLWDMINRNITSAYENELQWVKKLRESILSNNYLIEKG